LKSQSVEEDTELLLGLFGEHLIARELGEGFSEFPKCVPGRKLRNPICWNYISVSTRVSFRG
jgi:hypothetical protein